MAELAGIIGAGAEGSHLGEVLKSAGLDVVISDIDREKAKMIAGEKRFEVISDPRELARSCDIVFYSVPIEVTPRVIEETAPEVRENSAIVDLTSVKAKAVEAMQKYGTQKPGIFSMHLMYRPTVSPWGQNVAMIPIRPTKWYSRLEQIFKKAKANVSSLESATEHDELMSIIQVLAQTTGYTFLKVVQSLSKERPIEQIERFSTLLFRLVMESSGRIVSNPNGGNMYGSIQTENPLTLDVYSKIMQTAGDMKKLVELKVQYLYRI